MFMPGRDTFPGILVLLGIAEQEVFLNTAALGCGVPRKEKPSATTGGLPRKFPP